METLSRKDELLKLDRLCVLRSSTCVDRIHWIPSCCRRFAFPLRNAVVALQTRVLATDADRSNLITLYFGTGACVAGHSELLRSNAFLLASGRGRLEVRSAHGGRSNMRIDG